VISARGPGVSLVVATVLLTVASWGSWPPGFTVAVALLTTWPLFIVLDQAAVRQSARHAAADEQEVAPLGVLIGAARTIALLASLVARPVSVLIAGLAPIFVALSIVGGSSSGDRSASTAHRQTTAQPGPTLMMYAEADTQPKSSLQ
jgi:hypothetical protein